MTSKWKEKFNMILSSSASRFKCVIKFHKYFPYIQGNFPINHKGLINTAIIKFQKRFV